MKIEAAVFRKVQEKLTIEAVDIDKPLGREVLVRTVATGVCHSDLHVIDGIVNLSAAVVRGWARLSGLFDLYVVDGLVNLVGDVTQFVGRRVRNVQTGAVSTYLYVVILGVVGGVLLYWSWAMAS